jgi:hypothetical protein
MAVQRCPKCGLVNPASATRCDCGRSFVDGSMGEARKIDRGHHDGARHPKWLYGLALVSIALVGLGVWLSAGVGRRELGTVGDTIGATGALGLAITIIILRWRAMARWFSRRDRKSDDDASTL